MWQNKYVFFCVLWLPFTQGCSADINSDHEFFTEYAVNEQDTTANPQDQEVVKQESFSDAIQDSDFGAPYRLHGVGGVIEIKPGPVSPISQGRYLRGQIFQEEYGRVYDISLDRANLESAHFGGTAFIRWSFRGANMKNVTTGGLGEVYEGAEFIDCNFTDANIAGAQFNHLSPKNLVQTVNYQWHDLSNIKIAGWSHWSNPNELKRQPFARSDEVFSWSVPNYDDPPNLDFSGFNLENSVLPGDLRGCDFTDARINGATIGSAVFADGSRHCIMDQLKSTQNYKLGVFNNVTFVWHDFSGMDFSYMNLTGCHFLSRYARQDYKCNFQNAIFTDAVISNCDFSDAENLTLESIKSTWNYKVGRMEGIQLPKELHDALDADVN